MVKLFREVKMKNKGLNFNQEAFCQYYANGGEYFGNGVWSYILAYKLDIPLISYSALNESQKRIYETAKVRASNELTNVNIKQRCNELLDALIKDEIVDRELAKVILQNKELSAKVAAIKEYNQVKGRIKPTLALSFDIKQVKQARDVIRGLIKCTKAAPAK